MGLSFCFLSPAQIRRAVIKWLCQAAGIQTEWIPTTGNNSSNVIQTQLHAQDVLMHLILQCISISVPVCVPVLLKQGHKQLLNVQFLGSALKFLIVCLPSLRGFTLRWLIRERSLLSSSYGSKEWKSECSACTQK